MKKDNIIKVVRENSNRWVDAKIERVENTKGQYIYVLTMEDGMDWGLLYNGSFQILELAKLYASGFMDWYSACDIYWACRD